MEAKKVMFYSLLIVLLFFALSFFFDSLSMTGNVVNEGNVQDERLQIKGSDTLLQMVSNLAESYSQKNPAAKISVTGGGSGTGIASLINGEVDVADASRKIKEEEADLASSRGVDSYEFIVARDMLSVIVNEDSPVYRLALEDIGKVFRGEIVNWNELGGPDKEITLYGRQSTSGTYSFFRGHVVEGDYSSSMRNMEGNQAILEAVRQDKSGIGYVGIGYVRDDSGEAVDGINVLSVGEDGSFVSALSDSPDSYPISRPLFQYFAKKPVEGSLAYDFLDFELSARGQDIVEGAGFVRISEEDRQHNEKMFSLS